MTSINIPKLRFPEFEDGWEKKTVGEVAEIKTGNKDTQNRVDNGKFPFFVRSNTVERINSFSFDGEAILTSGDGVGVGKNFHYINGKFDFHQRVYSIRNFNHGISGKFVYSVFSEKFYNRVIKLSAKNSVDSVRMDMIADMEIFFPSLAEQQKIASFLTAVDDNLQDLKKKKSLLEQYKKGVMQKIFNQELRFKDEDGSEFPEWEEKSLGEVCEHLSSGKDKPNENDDYPIYGSMGIIGFSSNFSYERKVILIARVGANAGTINIVEGKFGVTDNTLVLINKIEFDIAFVYYLLIFQNLNKLVFGSGQPLITAGHLKSINLKLPYFTEQIKIANFLSAIDEKINGVSGQIEKMEVWKKGLLQKMFV
jgi:type I restriction enzyme, S subunit